VFRGEVVRDEGVEGVCDRVDCRIYRVDRGE